MKNRILTLVFCVLASLCGSSTLQAATSKFDRHLGVGMTDAETNGRVSVLQKELKFHGFDCGKIDGIFGPDTKDAVAELQRIHGIPQTGFVGRLTTKKLNDLCRIAKAIPVTLAAPKAKAVAVAKSSPVKTIYDGSMRPVYDVFATMIEKNLSEKEIKNTFWKARCIRYMNVQEKFTPATPEITEQRRAGDCKGKSLWFINALGNPNARFVVGKYKKHSREGHAWVELPAKGKNGEEITWIYDPTINYYPVKREKVGNNTYLKWYSYGKDGARDYIRFSKTSGRPEPIGGS